MENKNNQEIFITVIGFDKYHGTNPFKINKLLKLVKEPENNYDQEAIGIYIRYAGRSGYVANSVNTVVKGTMSAGRVYDKILKEDYAEVKFIANNCIIAKILSDEELEELKKDENSDIHFLSNSEYEE